MENEALSSTEKQRMVSLDLLCLDKEIETYGNDLYLAGLDLAKANSLRDSLKEDLEIVDAELASALRNAATSASTRITESQIKLDLLITTEHAEAFNRYVEAQETAAKVYAFVKSMEAKKEMISCAAKLACAGLIDLNDTSSLKKEVERKRMDISTKTA
jgi:hypothetical protein